MAKRREFVKCRFCGQRGDEPPGFALSDYPKLEMVFVLNDDMTGVEPVGFENLPQKLTCRNCGRSVAVKRGAVRTIKEKSLQRPENRDL